MRRRRTVRRHPLTWVGLLLGFVVAATLIGGLASADAGPSRGTAAVPSGDEVEVAADVTTVVVGFYAVTLQGLNQADSSYYADFFLWMRWSGDRDPTATLELTNNIERWGLTMAAVYDKPKVLPSGEKIQQYRVQGQFFQPLDLTDYPIDTQTLSLTVEDTTYATDELVYVADTDESGYDSDLRLPGWNISGSSVSVQDHTYDTGFGEEETSTAARTYSAAQFDITIERPRTFFLWKLLLPLVIVLLLASSVLFVHPTLTEVRLAAPATALLSLVFLQQTYSSTLPEIGALVLLDEIYALAYAVIIVLILTTTITSYWVRNEDEVNTKRAFRLDHIAAAASLGIFAVGSAVLVAIAVTS